MKLRHLTAPSIALSFALTFVACASDDAQSSDTFATDSPSGSTSATALGEEDIEFAQGMIAHHEQAIEMAEIALDPTVGASPAVTDLATRIKAAQDPEVELMTGWLTAAGEPIVMDTSEGHEMSSMDGMMTAEQMDALAAMNGGEFDRTWVEMMIAHHEGAISQSESVKDNGSNPDVLALADQIIAAQRVEITEMQALLDG